MDAVRFLADLAAGQAKSPLRLGMAQVRSVDSDPVYAISTGQAVVVPASQEWGNDGEVVAAYLGEYPPRPGGLCWYATDGADRIVLGMVAPEGPPSVFVRQDGTVSIANATNATVTFDTTVYDPWNMLESTSTQLTIPATGIYSVAGYANWNSNATGMRRIFLSVNGSSSFASQWFNQIGANTGGATIQSVTAPGISLSKGDTVALRVYHEAGSALNLNSARLSAVYVGRTRSTAAPEMLDDGGFQSGQIDTTDAPWTSFTSGGGAVSITTTTPRTGVYALQLALASAGSAVAYSAQTWPVVPRAQYRITAWSRTTAGTVGAVAAQHTRARLLCSVDGTPLDDTAATAVPTLASSYRSASTAWAQSTWDVTIPDGVFVAQLELAHVRTATAGTVLVDDVSITEIIR